MPNEEGLVGTTILTLVENTAGGMGLMGEHGMSFWVETGGGAVLFDAGRCAHSERFVLNRVGDRLEFE